ncbi:methyl-accepting chemotaxis protein [Bacillus sp. FJAT-42376]|uniref:methyl-accepting chemotaxis protein n=1 Tax=Bacillus sp. FJAT-42376 TaxID=2014076 RepID=UPI0013DE4EA1|nr:methyl-accepting chemotaxis protein [Bacillus sp. FJAT-42376]
MLWKKLTFSYGLVLVFLLLVAGVNVYALNVLYGKADEIVHEAIPLIEAVNAPEKSLVGLETAVMQFIMTQNESSLSAYTKDYKQAEKDLSKAATYGSKYPEIKKQIEIQQKQLKEMKIFYDEQIELVRNFDVVTAQMNLSEKKLMENYRASKNKELDMIKRINADSLNSAGSLKNQIMLISLFFSVLAISAVLVVAYKIIRSISMPVRRVSMVLDQVANGNLAVHTEESTRKDEIGDMLRSLHKMVADLRETVSQVSGTSSQVAAQSVELAASTEQGSRAAEFTARIAQETMGGFGRQQKSFHSISDSIHSVTKGIHHIAANSDSMISATNEAAMQAENGSAAVQNLAVQMEGIHLSVEETTSIIQELGRHSEQIDHIVRMITTISEQTNLLALNAAIEAARAGEHGKGFAVVADEVRKLAEESKNSAAEISHMVHSIQTETGKAVESMNVNKKKIADGLFYTNDAKTALSNIVQSIQETFAKGEAVRTEVLQAETVGRSIMHSLEKATEVMEHSVQQLHQSHLSSEEQLNSIEVISQSAILLETLSGSLKESVLRFKLEETEEAREPEEDAENQELAEAI